MSNNTMLVDVREVVKDYEGPLGLIHALKRVNLQVGKGEFVGIRGPCAIRRHSGGCDV